MKTASWTCLRVVLPLAQREQVSQTLMALGCLGIEETLSGGRKFPVRQPWDATPPPTPEDDKLQLLAWFETDENNDQRLEQAQGAYPTLEWSQDQVEDGGWEERWRRDFHPFTARSFPEGPYQRELVVAPPWQAEQGSLVIEPGMAFGTGQHPTTLNCLRAILSQAASGETLLDVGCGSGILALAAARLGLQVYGLDNDPAAVAAALDNAARNAITGQFDGRPLQALSGRWDMVVANIFAESLVQMAPALMDLTGRLLILSGILQDREPLIQAAFARFTVHSRHQDGEWLTYQLTPP